MANANKDKGDRAEAAVREYVQEFFPESWRTRAGWDDDRGDIVMDLLGDKVLTYAIQVKDTATPPGGPEIKALAEQVHNGEHQGGVIWWKLRGKGHPKDWRVVMDGEAYMALMSRVRNMEETMEGVYLGGRNG